MTACLSYSHNDLIMYLSRVQMQVQVNSTAHCRLEYQFSGHATRLLISLCYDILLTSSRLVLVMIRFPTFHATSPHTKTAQESLAEILQKCDQRRRYIPSGKDKMPSSKGKPTDPKLREEVKEEVKQESKGRSVKSASLVPISLSEPWFFGNIADMPQVVGQVAGQLGKP